MSDALSLLVDDVEVLQAAWEREPFVSTGLVGLDGIFSLPAVEDLLNTGMPVEAVRLFRDGELLPRQRTSRGREPGVRWRDHLADAGKVLGCVAEGATLVLDDLASYSPAVAAVTAELDRQTGYQSDCAAFLTPGWARGVGPHFDQNSVFVRQLSGAKRWRVYAPETRWPNRRANRAVAVADREPLLDVTLRSGDCLYIPRGFVHVGDTSAQPSVHLTFGVWTTTWEAIFAAMLGTAVDGCADLRESLPPSFAPADREQLFAERFALLAERLAKVSWSDIAVESFRTSAPWAPPLAGALARALSDGSRPASS